MITDNPNWMDISVAVLNSAVSPKDAKFASMVDLKPIRDAMQKTGWLWTDCELCAGKGHDRNRLKCQSCSGKCGAWNQKEQP